MYTYKRRRDCLSKRNANYIFIFIQLGRNRCSGSIIFYQNTYPKSRVLRKFVRLFTKIFYRFSITVINDLYNANLSKDLAFSLLDILYYREMKIVKAMYLCGVLMGEMVEKVMGGRRSGLHLSVTPTAEKYQNQRPYVMLC